MTEKPANYTEFTELPEWTRAIWSGPGKVVNDDDPFKWSGNTVMPPKIGEIVHVYMNNFGDVKVTGYFVEYGWLGILGEVLTPPDWWVEQKKHRPDSRWSKGKYKKIGHFFGVDLEKR